jgi:hypothetical protein
MADDATTGDGPGAEKVTLKESAWIAVYLVVLTFTLMFLLMWVWPSCEVSSDTAQPTDALMVTSITPSSGRISGGDAVTIRGTGFIPETKVRFDNIAAADIKFVDSTSLIADSPAHASGRVNIVVSNPDKESYTLAGGFIYFDPQAGLPKPSITSLTPTLGPLTGGQLVTISGSGFLGVATVSFGGLPGRNVQVLSNTTLTTTTPAHPEGKVDVVVGEDSTSTATLSGGYTYTCWGTIPYRLVLMVILAGALGGTLHGLRSLFWYVGNRDLRWSWLMMYFLLPVSGAAIAVIFFLVAYAGLYTVQGTGSFILVGLAALVGMFSPQAAEKLKKIAEGLLTSVEPGKNTVVPQPTVGAGQPATFTVMTIKPPSGSSGGGTPVMITGTGFSGVTTVTFGGVPAVNVQAVNDTTITATTPPHAAGAVDVVVGGGPTVVTLPSGYTYTP